MENIYPLPRGTSLGRLIWIAIGGRHLSHPAWWDLECLHFRASELETLHSTSREFRGSLFWMVHWTVRYIDESTRSLCADDPDERHHLLCIRQNDSFLVLP